MTVVLVVVGGAVGASLRYLAGHFLDRRTHWGTLLVNVVGSFLLGLLVADGLSRNGFALWATGFCGALTTYSAFAVQAVDAGPRRGLAYGVGTVLACTLAAWCGLSLG